MSNLKIICDSLADVPENLIKRYDIEIIPLTIRINDIEYKDGVNITNEEFYKLIKESNEIPKHLKQHIYNSKKYLKNILMRAKEYCILVVHQRLQEHTKVL